MTDTTARIAERIAERTAREFAVAEREARYPVLTPHNFCAALVFQSQRIRELTAA